MEMRNNEDIDILALFTLETCKLLRNKQIDEL